MTELYKALAAHDSFSGGHAWRTSRYARALALAMGFEEGDVFLAQLGALLHDVGRVGIPDAVLLKQGRITKEELRHAFDLEWTGRSAYSQ